MHEDRAARIRQLRVLEGQEIDRGRYRLERLVGTGATGGVFLGRQRGLPRPVAIKVVRMSSLARRRRFLREIVAMASVTSPHLPVLLDQGSLDEQASYVVMEWVGGRSCARRVAAEGPLSPQASLEVMAQVLSALSAVHAAGLVHRDVKPANVIMDEGRAGLPSKLVDLGVARLPVGPDLGLSPMTLPGCSLGTPGFMAPEQALGAAVDGRADLWSAGVLLRFLCAGGAAPAYDERLPSAIRAIVRVATRPLPEGRPASAEELLSLVLDAASALRRQTEHAAPTLLISRSALDPEATRLLGSARQLRLA